MFLQPFHETDLAVTRVRPFQSLPQARQLPLGEREVFGLETFPVHPAAVLHAGVIQTVRDVF